MRPYNDYNSYLRERYGSKVYRIGLDAGFSCPNRDGTKGFGGCLYCDEKGSRSPYVEPKTTVRAQLGARIKYLKEAKKADKFIAYFQAFTNTHASSAELKDIYDSILPFDNIVGLSIGTRPDAVDTDKLKLISSYKLRYETWIEYGLQSSHDNTLKFLNRGHSYKDFADTVALTKVFGISVCAHVILGLPHETRSDIIETANKLNGLGIDGIKIHAFHVLKGSAAERLYNNKELKLLSQDEYAEWVCDFLENMSGKVIVQRLTAQGSGESHVAPGWALDKDGTIRKIEDIFKNRNSRQGSKIK